jgi:mono/diheme cytochrome c family protein
MHFLECGVLFRRVGSLVPLCLAANILLAGCSRAPEPVYVTSEAALKLPETHQRQLRETVTRFFGTPLNPRLRLPTGEPAGDDMPNLVDVIDPDHLAHGATVFNRRCAVCHGITGDGNGEAAPYLVPKPRDYRAGTYKFTSTPYGAKPHRSDLIRVIRKGAKGTSMPAFPWLPDEDVRAVVDYVKVLSYRGELEASVTRIAELDYDADEELDNFEFIDSVTRIHDAWEKAAYQVVLPETAQPKYSDETILAGRKAFLSKGCSKCHGENGQGQTDWLSSEFIAAQEALSEEKREKINYDTWGDVAPAADITARMLHGGRRPIDIYRRIHTGINGTPMPAFAQALSQEPETLWHLVHYVKSIVEGRDVEGLDQVVADEPPAPLDE